MIGWLNKCWGGMGVSTVFERARIASTYADWNVPDHAFIVVLLTFAGQNKQTNAQAAVNSFFAHLEQDDCRKNAAFLLKNLLILDLAVQQRLFLTKIGHYHNSQFHYIDSGVNQLISSSVKDLISNYYEYIRTKAKLYSTQALELVKKQSRQNFMKSSNSITMLNQINICFKIQNSVLTVSDCFTNGNKSPPIIQLIFSSLLKTYLFCFSIVSLALKTFISRISELSRYDLEYLGKLSHYFSKDYTRNFLLFIERNKLIDSFKSLKYNQLIILDDKIVGIIENKLQQLDQDIPDIPQPSNFPIQLKEALIVQKIQVEGLNNPQPRESDSNVRIRRKKLQLLRGETLQQQPQSCFYQYVNFYNEDFVIDQQQMNKADRPQGTNPNKKPSQIQKKKKVYTKLSFIKDVMAPNLKKQISMQDNKKFNKQVWDAWQNIYSS